MVDRFDTRQDCAPMYSCTIIQNEAHRAVLLQCQHTHTHTHTGFCKRRESMKRNTFPATTQRSAAHSAGMTRQPCGVSNSAQRIDNDDLISPVESGRTHACGIASCSYGSLRCYIVSRSSLMPAWRTPT